MAFGKAPKDPFGTAVGSLVDRATFGSLQTEEWGQFMHICDVINATEEGPKDAVKALKKKLAKNCNHKEIRLTLSLLDMCMQNCGPRFQSLVVKKDFCKDKLVKLLNPRYNLPIELQEKILTFIMVWARGFQGMVDVTEVKEVYLELLKKGVEFPSSDSSKGRPKQSPSSAKSSPSSATPPKRSLLPLPTGPTLLLTPEQIGKLYSELDMAKMNVRVMSSILKENVPGSENPDDMNLLQKLYKTCRMMQERIMELLVTVENEDVIVELIQVNEDLNNVLLGHERQEVRWRHTKIILEFGVPFSSSTVDLPSVCYKSFGSGDGHYIYIYIYTSRKEYTLSFLKNFDSFNCRNWPWNSVLLYCMLKRVTCFSQLNPSKLFYLPYSRKCFFTHGSAAVLVLTSRVFACYGSSSLMRCWQE
uniref:Target of myb1 like 1 membrane trafficking protein n=1 Tax=Chrysolophus pictus TaxID=9089 RepID=A0A8C3LVW7_CHRPC